MRQLVVIAEMGIGGAEAVVETRSPVTPPGAVTR